MDKQNKIKILQDLIHIHSVNGNEVEVSKYIGKLFDKYGIKYKIDEFGDKRANLVAEIGQGKTDQVLAFTGHQDTVAIGDQSEWTHDPFSGDIDGDKIYGRGSADMKIGLAAQIITLIELTENKTEIPGKIRFIATAGEEYGTPGANRLNDQGIAKDISAMVVGEPTSGNIVYAHSGSMNYQIKSSGRAFHSSAPEKGINAITGLVQYINDEPRIFGDLPKDPYLGEVKHSVTVIKGGDQVNIIPEHAELLGNIRPTMAFNNDKVIETIQTEVEKINKDTEFHLDFSLIHNFRPVETDPKNKFVQMAKSIADAEFSDRQIQLVTINGATDASVFVKGNAKMPIIILGADAWDKAHQIDEYTTIKSFTNIVNVYESLATKFFK